MPRIACILNCAVLAMLFAYEARAGEPVTIAAGSATNQPKQPQLVVGNDGSIHCVYGIGNTILYSRSSDLAKNFSTPTKLGGDYVMSLGMRRGPRIAASGDVLCITAIGGKEGKGRDGDILAYHSMDQGKTWEGPVLVNDSPGSAREGLHAMAGHGSQLCCVWLDLRSGTTEIYAATSKNGGQSWGKNIRVYRSPDGSVCECCHPSVAYDATGKLHVMWRNSLDESRDMYLRSSTDRGLTFGDATKLGVGTWQLDACPMDGGYLAVSPKGAIFTAWRRDSDIFLTADSSKERRLGKGRQPWIAANEQGPYTLWLEDRTGRLLIQMPDSDKIVQLTQKANDPVIASNSNVDLVVAAWEERQAMNTALVCQIVSPKK